jgi:hypothetical protein
LVYNKKTLTNTSPKYFCQAIIILLTGRTK